MRTVGKRIPGVILVLFVVWAATCIWLSRELPHAFTATELAQFTPSWPQGFLWDAQYIIVSVGMPTQVLENPTSDPESVLKVVESKDFQKLFMGSRKSSVEADLRSFRRSLDEARAACDAGDPARSGSA